MFSIDFQNIPNIKQFFTSSKINNFWIHCSDKNTPWRSADLSQAKIWKRLLKTSEGNLLITRFADEPFDLINGDSLRPRIEVCIRSHLIPKKVPIHIEYVFSMVKGGKNFRGLIFQLMDKTVDGNTCPLFQIEGRDGKLHSRWSTILNGVATRANIKPFCKSIFSTEQADGKKDWHKMDVYVFLDDSPNGKIKMYHNGVLVFDRKALNCSAREDDVQCSFGIYAVPNFELQIEVRSLKIELAQESDLT